MQEKLKIIDNQHVGKQNTPPTCTMLHFVRSVSLDIWRVERYVFSGLCGSVSLPLIFINSGHLRKPFLREYE